MPTIGALAMGAQRLMPLVQMIYRGGAYVLGHRMLLTDVVELLIQPITGFEQEDVAPLDFTRCISISNLSFQYTDESQVLKDVNIEIPRGAIVGFVGTTGSGKSTLIDIIMGLLEPTSGFVAIDEVPLHGMNCRAWRANIANVSQSVYLVDSSFRDNIAFAVPTHEIDQQRVERAAKLAQIADYIESTPQGYDSFVGERGVRISGGQRQRIGIARAIYKGAKVLVLDEATSALDSETERAVINAVITSQPGITILMIAHRTSTLSKCDYIFQVIDGRVTATSFAHLDAAT